MAQNTNSKVTAFLHSKVERVRGTVAEIRIAIALVPEGAGAVEVKLGHLPVDPKATAWTQRGTEFHPYTVAENTATVLRLFAERGFTADEIVVDASTVTDIVNGERVRYKSHSNPNSSTRAAVQAALALFESGDMGDVSIVHGSPKSHPDMSALQGFRSATDEDGSYTFKKAEWKALVDRHAVPTFEARQPLPAEVVGF